MTSFLHRALHDSRFVCAKGTQVSVSLTHIEKMCEAGIVSEERTRRIQRSKGRYPDTFSGLKRMDRGAFCTIRLCVCFSLCLDRTLRHAHSLCKFLTLGALCLVVFIQRFFGMLCACVCYVERRFSVSAWMCRFRTDCAISIVHIP